MTLHVACAARGRYVAHSRVLLRSLAAVGRGAGELHVHYLHAPGLSRRARRALERAAAGAVAFHPVPDSVVAGLPVRDYFTAAMWYRIALPELVGEPRVLYLDVDTLALDDLGELWATDLGGALVGAVTNVFADDHRFHAADLGIDPADYFNSGVLLLDLDGLRREGVATALREVARRRAGLRGWPDQDALNLVLGARREPLHPRFNAMNAIVQGAAAEAVFGAAAVAQARARPAIRHFEGPAANKPWVRGSRVAHRDAWRAQRRAARLQAFTARRAV